MPALTLECAMVGAHTTESPIHGASSAVCTGRSTIDGLGVVASTSVLASTEIKYMPVTIIAGLEKIAAASQYAATALPSSSTGAAEASAITHMPLMWRSGAAAAAVAVFAVL